MDTNIFKVNQSVNLADIATKLVDTEAKDKLKKVRKKLSKLQDTMYAHGKYSVLVCLQGMDTSGKDSLIREVFKNFNTQGINVHSFKQPSELELKHDFLWRHYLALPERGKFGVFNRTHYENVLVTRVHPNYIFGENNPRITNIEQLNDSFYHQRMESIVNFENHLVKSGTVVLKFFLNLSKEEQKNRLLRRLELQEKNWKFSAGDLKERKLWDKYMFCYEDLLNRTSTVLAPWHIIPADDKPTCRLIVAETILKTLEKFKDIEEPELDKETQANIAKYKQSLENEF